MLSGQEPWYRRELTGRKLIWHVCWQVLHWGVFAYGWYTQVSNQKLALLNTLKFSVWASRGAGLVLAMDGFLIMLAVCRNLITWLRPKIRFLPLDENLWFHRQTAYMLLLFTIIHTTAHYVNFFNVEAVRARPVTALQIHYADAGGITGHVMLLCMLLMYTTAHAPIRKQSFEAFWYTHHLAFIFVLALYTHATGCFVRDTTQPYSPFAGEMFWTHCIGYEGWRLTLWSGGLYFLERVWRVVNSRRDTKITKVVMHPQGAMEIQFRKPSFRYTPGQWIFINVPAVSGWQWHPFTITSCPSDPFVSVHIRQVGDFTTRLGQVLGTQAVSAGMENALLNGRNMPTLRVDGPFGAPAEDVLDNEIAVLVGAGIGVTPWASVLKHILSQFKTAHPPQRLRRVEFIWIVPNIDSFEWFQNLLANLEQEVIRTPHDEKTGLASGASSQFLRVHNYLTAKLDESTVQNIMINDAGALEDPLTGLKSRTHYGRPNWKAMFTGMRDGIERGTYIRGLAGKQSKVGVYICGPSVMAKQLKRECNDASSEFVNCTAPLGSQADHSLFMEGAFLMVYCTRGVWHGVIMIGDMGERCLTSTASL